MVAGYALLGACWLNLKTHGDLQAQGAAAGAGSPAIGTLALIGVVSLWTPFLNPIYFTRWFPWPTAIFSALVPVLLAGCALGVLARA